MSRLLRDALLVALVAGVGCNGEVVRRSAVDGGSGSADGAAPPSEAAPASPGTPLDGPSPTDAARPTEGGSREDAGVPNDAGATGGGTTSYPYLAGVNLAGAEFGSVGGAYGSAYTYPTHEEVDYYTGKGMKSFGCRSCGSACSRRSRPPSIRPSRAGLTSSSPTPRARTPTSSSIRTTTGTTTAPPSAAASRTPPSPTCGLGWQSASRPTRSSFSGS